MRFIDIRKLKDTMGEEKFNEWVADAAAHLKELRKLDKKGRSAYFKAHGSWTKLYSFLSELSHHKCWYTEAPENSSRWDVEHFRPKNRSNNFDGAILLAEGYWWLAYEWKNYRLCGSLVNLRVKDIFDDSEEVSGKGNFFPLDLTSCTPCEPDGNLDEEVPYLLDPINFRDTTLLGFDKDGQPISNYPDGTFECKKVTISIKFLNLNNTVLNRKRKEVWENTQNHIVEISRRLAMRPTGCFAKRLLMIRTILFVN